MDLHNQLIKLGDMIGDGLHLEPDGNWISKEYAKVASALGYSAPKKGKANPHQVNEKMAQRCREVRCQKCDGALRQTRSGSMRAKCLDCGAKFQLLRKAKS